MSEPVLIVGAGPTGLTAALELSRFGIPVRLIDKRAQPADTSRAIGVQARTLELLARRGLADKLIARGNPSRGGSVFGGGKTLFELNLTGIDSPFPFLLLVSQVETERLLREAVEGQGVRVEWGVELVSFRQDTDSDTPRPVTATLRHGDGDCRLETTEAAYLISAEGAHSVVRSTLDLPFAGHTRVETYALGDLRVETKLPADEFQIFSSDHGFMAIFPLEPGHVRLIVSDPLGDTERALPPTLEEFQTTFDQRSHIPARFHVLTWASWFRINSRMISHLQVGRCFLGGDSAHIHSPAGAQGMNTGIQDMINLCWKLALVLQGKATPHLLETYGEDRLPVIRSVLTNTDRITSVMGSENPLIRSLVNHLAPWIGHTGIFQINAPTRMSQIAIDYRVSHLSKQWGSDASLHAGDRMPDLAVRMLKKDGKSWDETTIHPHLDPSRFVLLIVQAEEPATIRAAASPWADLITTVEIDPPTDTKHATQFQHAFGLNSGAFLVRPDGYLGLAVTGPKAAYHLAGYFRDWFTEPTLK